MSSSKEKQQKESKLQFDLQQFEKKIKDLINTMFNDTCTTYDDKLSILVSIEAIIKDRRLDLYLDGK